LKANNCDYSDEAIENFFKNLDIDYMEEQCIEIWMGFTTVFNKVMLTPCQQNFLKLYGIKGKYAFYTLK